MPLAAYELHTSVYTTEGSLNARKRFIIDENQTELNLGEIETKER